MISRRRVCKNSRCLLQSVVQDGDVLLCHGTRTGSTPAAELGVPGVVGSFLLFLEDADPLSVGRESGLGVVQEGLADGVGRELLIVGQEMDGGWGRPLRALVEQDFGEGVRGEEGHVVANRRGLSRVHEDAGRGLDSPGAEMDGLAVGDDGRGWQAALGELGEELGGVGRAELGGRDVGHGAENGGRVTAELVVGLREVERGREVQGVGHGVGREEHDVGELRGEADLADAGDDLVEPGGGLGCGSGLWWGIVQVGGGHDVGLVLEGLRLDDEALDSRRAGGGW